MNKQHTTLIHALLHCDKPGKIAARLKNLWVAHHVIFSRYKNGTVK